MQWIEVNIYTTTDGIEPLCGRLYAVGLNGVQIKDAADFNDFIENETQYWDYIDESLEPLRDMRHRISHRRRRRKGASLSHSRHCSRAEISRRR